MRFAHRSGYFEPRSNIGMEEHKRNSIPIPMSDATVSNLVIVAAGLLLHLAA
jgi:hypothetical protein